MIYNNIYLNNDKQKKCKAFLKSWTSIPVNFLCSILCFSLLSNLAIAQCTDTGNYWNNSWVSCNTRTNPNPERPDSHWILYEFHQAENISESFIWNANREGESQTGARDVLIDYSVDGSTWVQLGAYTFSQANENENYIGFEGPDFGGIFIQKILITILNTYGDGTCASIAEVQFKINPDACYGIIDECGECNGTGVSTWYIDADNDGLGHTNTSIQTCTQPAGYVANADDYCDNNLLGWREVGAIFSDNGCNGCHGDNALGGLNLTTYENAILGGNKCGTNILTGTTLTDIITISGYAGCGPAIGIPSMNQRVGGQIDNDELALLQTWIDAGTPEDCNCLVGAPDTDNDETCDAIDNCPNFDNRLIGTPCDDGLICTENDVWTAVCDCKGQLATDSDNDGVCDIEDTAPNDPCTADGIIDGAEPTAWIALPTNDCDTDGINNTSGDLNDFAPCIDNKGLINTAACNCPTNMLLAGGRMTKQISMNAIAGFADGLPDGKMSSYLGNKDSLHLSFPYMPVGEQICITLSFSDANGIVNFNMNDNSFTYSNFTGLDNFQPQEFCIETLTEGEQTIIITKRNNGGLYVDGSTYSYCPCGENDPKFESPSCNCTYDTASENGNYISSIGFANGEEADGAPDSIFTDFLGYLDTLNLAFPNVTAGAEICVTLGFNDKNGLVKFDMGSESAYFANLTQDSLYTPQKFCFINKSGTPNIAITKIGNGVIKVDGSRYNYCSDCPADINGNLPIQAQIHTWLEGSYDPTIGEMTTALNQLGLLPGQTPTNPLSLPTPAGQPYSTAPWNYSGTEGATWSSANYANREMDWVLVSFRTGTTQNTEVGKTAALLYADGSIRFPDRCALPHANTPLYVIIEHRNHVGVMSPNPVDIQNNVLKYDFRRRDSYKLVTSFGQKQSPTGQWLMFAGDANQMDSPSFDVNGIDKIEWSGTNGGFGYYFSSDFNLDGDINGQDKILWFYNNGVSSRVPK